MEKLLKIFTEIAEQMAKEQKFIVKYTTKKIWDITFEGSQWAENAEQAKDAFLSRKHNFILPDDEIKEIVEVVPTGITDETLRKQCTK